MGGGKAERPSPHAGAWWGVPNHPPTRVAFELGGVGEVVVCPTRTFACWGMVLGLEMVGGGAGGLDRAVMGPRYHPCSNARVVGAGVVVVRK